MRRTTHPSIAQRATLGAISNGLQMVVNGLSGLVATPLVIRGLGAELYGAWSMIQQAVGYVALADLRASTTIKLNLAAAQHLEDPHMKRQQVGAALYLFLAVAPIIVLLGLLVVWVAPHVVRTDARYVGAVRWAAAIGVLAVMATDLLAIPGNVVRGSNLEYRAMGARAGVVACVSALNVGAVWLGLGLVGLAVANVLGALAIGALWYSVARSAVPWFGMERPSGAVLSTFSAQTFWLLISSLGHLLLYASDALVLGYVLGPAAAAVYTTTGLALRLVVEPMYQMIGAAGPGLGGLGGRGEHARVAALRVELHLVALLVIGVAGAGTLALNEAFLGLWVGEGFFAGDIVNALFVGLALATIPVRADAMLVDAMRLFRPRALLTVLSGILSATLGGILASDHGAAGMAAGVLTGRLVAAVGFPWLLHRVLGASVVDYAKAMLRPLLVTAGLWVVALALHQGVVSRLSFLGMALAWGGGAAAALWGLGLDGGQRQLMRRRIAHQVGGVWPFSCASHW